MSALLLRGRLAIARLMIVAAVALLSACTNDGTVNWHVVQTTETPGPSSSPCPYGPLADAPGCQPAPTPTPSSPAGVDYVPYCLPSDPPGSYCQPAP